MDGSPPTTGDVLLCDTFTPVPADGTVLSLLLTSRELTAQSLGATTSPSPAPPRTSLRLADCVSCHAFRGEDPKDLGGYFTAVFYPLRGMLGSANHRKRISRTFRAEASRDKETNMKLARAWTQKIRQLSLEQGRPFLVPPAARVLVLLNPRGGTGKALALFEAHVMPMLAEADARFTLLVTERPNQAYETIRDQDLSNWDVIAVMSGDGLIFEVINGLMARPDWSEAIKKPLAVLPGGSGNALAASVNYYSGHQQVTGIKLLTNCAFILCKGQPLPLDIVSLTTSPGRRIFSFLSVAWGLISDVDIESEKYRFMGYARFSIGTFVRLTALRTYSGRLSFLPVSSSEPNSGGNLHPAAEPNRGSNLHPAAEPNRGGNLHPAAEPNRGGNLHPAAELNRGGNLHPAAEPNRGSNLHPAAEPNSGGNLHPAAEPNTGGNLHRAAEPNRGSNLLPAAELNIGGNLHPAAEPNRGGNFHPATEPNRGGNLHPAAEPNRGGNLHPAAEPNRGGSYPPAAELNNGGSHPPAAEPNRGGNLHPVAELNRGGNLHPAAELNIGGSPPSADSAALDDQLLVPLDKPVPSHWKVVDDQFVLVLALYQSHLGAEHFAAPMVKAPGEGRIHLYYATSGISRASLVKLFMAMEKGTHLDRDIPHLTCLPVTAFRIEPRESSGIMTVDGEVIRCGPIQGQIHGGLGRVVSIAQNPSADGDTA